jgi:hypothetical protein
MRQFFLFSLIFLLFFISNVSALDSQLEDDICLKLNLTYYDCEEFWILVNTIPVVYENYTYITTINETFDNSTYWDIEQTKFFVADYLANESDRLADWEHELEVINLTYTLKYPDGVPSNNGDSLDLDQIKALIDSRLSVDSRSNNNNNDIWIFAIIGIIILGAIFTLKSKGAPLVAKMRNSARVDGNFPPVKSPSVPSDPNINSSEAGNPDGSNSST